jgi:hypothetical protein
LKGVALLRERHDLLRQQRVGALQLRMAQQQALDALGDLIEGGGVGHTPPIVGTASPGNVKLHVLVLAAWFACRSSTGSREGASAMERVLCLRCPRNGQRMSRTPAPLSYTRHWVP